MIEEELQLLKALRERTGHHPNLGRQKSKKKLEKESVVEDENIRQRKDLEVSKKGIEKELDHRDSLEQDILAEPTNPLEEIGQPEMKSSCKPSKNFIEEPELEEDQSGLLSQEIDGVCGLSQPVDDLIASANESVCSAKDDE